VEEALKFEKIINQCPQCVGVESPRVEPMSNGRWICHDCNLRWTGEDIVRKKPEMIRRAKLVKWVRAQHDAFDMMYGRTSQEYLEGLAFVLNRLCDDFDIDGLDLQR
jgi:ribosomal protein L37AE/L43A